MAYPAGERIMSVVSDALGVLVANSAVHAHAGSVVAAHCLVSNETSVARPAPKRALEPCKCII